MKPVSIIVIVFGLILWSDLPILKINNRDDNSHPKNVSYGPVFDQVVEIHNNFPLSPMYGPVGGIFEVFLIPHSSEYKIIYGNGTYKGNDWVGYVHLKNITENNKGYTIKVYRTQNNKLSIKEFWLAKEVELPVEGDLILFRRSPGTAEISFKPKNSMVYFNATLKNYFNEPVKVKQVVYIYNKPIKYNDLTNHTQDSEFEIISSQSKYIGPHGYAKFCMGPVHIKKNDDRYFSMFPYLYDSEGCLVAYEVQVDWTKFETLKEPLKHQILN
ncbi:MAG TPA: hypothetical protein HA349_08830 [Methanotrichaceae archaeon]|nr:hypothetical protein [Methanotrichaceae archaeon]